jgi:hypothetical protein
MQDANLAAVQTLSCKQSKNVSIVLLDAKSPPAEARNDHPVFGFKQNTIAISFA